MSASTLKTLLRAHRWIGLILCVPLLLWAVTGVLHPIMSATQPQPTKRMPPPQVLDLTVVRPLPAVLQQSGYQHITQAQVVQLSQNQLAYRIVDNQTIGYYAADTGQPLPQGEQQHLSRLVAWYTDRPVSTIQHIQRVDQFNDDYPSVNRILPVWRVDLEHGLRAYLDPSQDRLVTLSNDPKYWMSRLFRLGHTWSWDEAQLPADRWLKTIVLLGGIGIAIVGLLLFIRLKNRKGQRLVSRPMQRWHRRMGVVAALFAICWMLSGL
ncbi:MAG: PepSY domain-containing protein, partial [Pseudomonadota bacterium]|nr:PepSY domain-containing protein [Pseudomonadota bacterium]